MISTSLPKGEEQEAPLGLEEFQEWPGDDGMWVWRLPNGHCVAKGRGSELLRVVSETPKGITLFALNIKIWCGSVPVTQGWPDRFDGLGCETVGLLLVDDNGVEVGRRYCR